jgi:hypothetical protein
MELESIPGPYNPSSTITATEDAAEGQGTSDSVSHEADILQALVSIENAPNQLHPGNETSELEPDLLNSPHEHSEHPTPTSSSTTNDPASSLSTGSNKTKEWKPILLRRCTLTFLVNVAIAAVVTIAVLLIVSRTHNGITTVGTNQISLGNISISRSILWTTLPVFLFNAYNEWFKSTVTACADRQPYVELYQQDDNGASSKQSVLLDYRAILAIKKPWIAGKRKHPLLCLGFVLSLGFSLLLSSLAAHLFVASSIILKLSRNIMQNTAFNQSGFGARSDLVPSMDVVSSTLVFGGSFPAWTTSKYCIERFSGLGEAGNFSLVISAYSANLSCVILDQSQYTLKKDGGSFNFNATDGGCSLSSSDIFGANVGNSDFLIYAASFANVGCSLATGSSRLVVITGQTPDPMNIPIGNITALSCQTTYWNISGTLDVSFESAEAPKPTILDYSESSAIVNQNPRPEFWKNFEQQLHQSSIIDPTAVTSATDFGRLVLLYAQQLDPINYIDSAIIKNATERVFTSTYSVMCSVRISAAHFSNTC